LAMPNGRFRRNLLVAARSGEGRLTKPITATGLWRWEPLFMPHTCPAAIRCPLGIGRPRPHRPFAQTSSDGTAGASRTGGGFGNSDRCLAEERHALHFATASIADHGVNTPIAFRHRPLASEGRGESLPKLFRVLEFAVASSRDQVAISSGAIGTLENRPPFRPS
jgi:hypothetical protein